MFWIYQLTLWISYVCLTSKVPITCLSKVIINFPDQARFVVFCLILCTVQILLHSEFNWTDALNSCKNWYFLASCNTLYYIMASLMFHHIFQHQLFKWPENPIINIQQWTEFSSKKCWSVTFLTTHNEHWKP